MLKFALEQLQEAAEEMMGFCTACGEQSEENVEPDARNYKCTACGEFAVFGAEELVIMGLVE
jgi:hypothetical protein